MSGRSRAASGWKTLPRTRRRERPRTGRRQQPPPGPSLPPLALLKWRDWWLVVSGTQTASTPVQTLQSSCDRENTSHMYADTHVISKEVASDFPTVTMHKKAYYLLMFLQNIRSSMFVSVLWSSSDKKLIQCKCCVAADGSRRDCTSVWVVNHPR